MKSRARQVTLTLAAATMLCATPVFAQTVPPNPPTAPDAPLPPPPPDGGGPRRGGPERRLEMLQQHLNLTPDQTTQIRAIFASERTRMEALRSDSALAPEDRRTQMMAIHQDSDAKVRGVLTSDQVTRYDAMQARMSEHRREGGAPPPPPPPPGA